MARIYVKGYTKDDGTPVKGYYRGAASKARNLEATGRVKKDRYGLFTAKGTGIPFSNVSEKAPKAYQLMARYNRMKVNTDSKRKFNEMLDTIPNTHERRALNSQYKTLVKLRRAFKK